MNKRDFLKRLVGFGSVAALPTIPMTDPTNPPVLLAGHYAPHYHRGYRLTWTGWKGSVETDSLHGQWIAQHPNHTRMVHLSVPGMIGGWHYPGSVFNLSNRTSEYVTAQTSETKRNVLISEGLIHMKRLLDDLTDPKGV